MSFFRDALRSLFRSPALGMAAIACIALGSAATTAIATLVDTTLVRPLPFPDAERLARVWFDEPAKEHICEESDDDLVLVKDRRGRVIGFERLNFLSARQRREGGSIPVEVQLG